MIYNYLFYTYYRFWEKAPSRWWSEWKAIITICFFLVFLFTTISNFIMIKTKWNLIPETRLLPIIAAIFIFGINYYSFLYKDKWKRKIVQFKSLERKTDTLGIIVVILLTALIIVSLIYSYYLLGSINWSEVK